MSEKNADRAREVAARCEDAYSFDRYAPGEWEKAARMMLDRGLTERETEAVLRSKWTRWAGNASSSDYGHVTSADLARFLDDPRNGCTPAEIRALARETFDE